jgi:AcrR family transcriptional regulator
MEDIAATAGISVGTLYNYFRDRGSLVNALLEVRRAALLQNLDTPAEPETPFGNRLARFVQTLASHFETSRPLLTLQFEQEQTVGHQSGTVTQRQTLREELLRRAEALIAAGISDGVLRDGDPAAYATLLVGMVRGTADTLLARGTGDFREMTPLIVDVFLRGASR